MNEFIAICEYFEISPADFFSEQIHYPELIKKAISGMEQLSDEDLLLVLNLIQRLLK